MPRPRYVSHAIQNELARNPIPNLLMGEAGEFDKPIFSDDENDGNEWGEVHLEPPASNAISMPQHQFNINARRISNAY